jgi:UDP:flavonoid glycosyltransferase YjiC (YdhE family)
MKNDVANQRKRILFLAEGITMTHFARPAALAEALDPAEWDVFFWTPRRYHPLLRRRFSGSADLATIEPAAFLDALAHGRTVYSADALRMYVEEDLDILREVRPDLVIGDFRLSLCISAPLAGVPFATIFNAHWSPYYSAPAIVPELALTRWVPPRLLGSLFAMARPLLYALHAKPANDVRRAFGLPALPHDIRSIFTAGDLVLYADVPEFVPLLGAPSHHVFVGTCSWEASTPRPAWWKEVMDSPVRKVFVSMGSSGSLRVVPAVLEAASQLPVRVVLSTSGRMVGPLPSNVYHTDLLPYEDTAKRCALVVSHGGTGGLYATLAAGTPMLAIPSNIDNHLSSALLTKHGVGRSIRAENASPQRIREALEQLWFEPGYKEAASRWATVIARYNTSELFPHLLTDWFRRRDAATA